jgi:hypothetical protein
MDVIRAYVGKQYKTKWNQGSDNSFHLMLFHSPGDSVQTAGDGIEYVVA